MFPAIAILATVFMGLAWPTAGANAQNVDRSETLIFSYPTNTGAPNPHQYSPSQMYAQELVYEALVSLSDTGEIIPWLAESWEISDDGLTYLFKLRPGVVFTDGTPFNAEAVVLNFKTAMDNKAEHDWLGIVNVIDSFRAVSENIFELKLKTPYSPILSDLATTRPFRFLSPKAFPDDGDTYKSEVKAPIGTGPWMKAETALGEYDLFVRNDSYWGQKPSFKNLLFKVIPDPISRAMAFEAGEIDIIYGDGQINFDVFKRFSETPGLTAVVSKALLTMALAMNTDKTPTSDLAVRLALEHAIDKKALTAGVTLSTYPTADFMFPPDTPFCRIDRPPYDFNLEKAAEILDKAGWVLSPGESYRRKDGQELVVDLCFLGNDASHKSLAEITQAQAAKAGIRINLLGEEPDSFYERQNIGDFNLIISETWGPPFDPHAYLSSMLVPSHADYAAQKGLAEKPHIDELIRTSRASIDESVMAKGYQEVLTILHDKAVYIPLYAEALVMVYRTDRITGAKFGPSRTLFPFTAMSIK
jgi:nickel transport system substrate-binding protein